MECIYIYNVPRWQMCSSCLNVIYSLCSQPPSFAFPNTFSGFLTSQEDYCSFKGLRLSPQVNHVAYMLQRCSWFWSGLRTFFLYFISLFSRMPNLAQNDRTKVSVTGAVHNTVTFNSERNIIKTLMQFFSVRTSILLIYWIQCPRYNTIYCRQEFNVKYVHPAGCFLCLDLYTCCHSHWVGTKLWVPADDLYNILACWLCEKDWKYLFAFDSHWGDSSFCNANNIAWNSGSDALGRRDGLNCVPLTLDLIVCKYWWLGYEPVLTNDNWLVTFIVNGQLAPLKGSNNRK